MLYALNCAHSIKDVEPKVFFQLGKLKPFLKEVGICVKSDNPPTIEL